MVLVALAGHGLQPDGSDDSFFCPVDANPFFRVEERGGEKVKVPADRNSLLSLNELLQVLLESGVGHKFLLIDACRNDPKVRGRRGVNHVNVAALPRQTAVLLSCSEGEFSFEPTPLRHGAFFYHVLEAMRGQAQNPAGAITWDSLASYVRDKVPVKVQELLGAEGGEQNPQLISNLAGRPFVLAHIPDRSKMDLTKPGTKKSPQPGDTIANSIGMKLAYIPAGEFMMGSPADEGFDNEHPQHAVEITKPFYLGVTESLRLLGEMGPEAKRAVPCLVKVINDPSRNYRRQAAMALLKIDPEAAKEVNAEEIASSRPTSED